MPYDLILTTQFKKDLKRMKRRGHDIAELTRIIDMLRERTILPAQYRDHPLSGNYSGFKECHIRPDWLLIYAIDNDLLVLTAIRTGTHSDLFSK